uniref:Ribosomal protein L30 n=1 Tax=Rhizophora mucronata TaxID=61149 RepID=A0A2P2IKC5_RHIMU
MESSPIYNLGEGHSWDQETSQAYLGGIATSQVQQDCHAMEYSYRQGNAATGFSI